MEPFRVIEFSTLPAKCAYLDNKLMRMEYKFIEKCPESLNQKLVERGWRRFGEYYSRPNCVDCKDCLSLRIDTMNYTFSKSAKKTIRKNQNTQFIIQKPTLSIDHLNLYEKYHKYMEEKKGWKHYSLNPNSYYELYASGSMNFGKEILYFVDDKLVGVDLVDILSDGLSSIYFFYDPNFAHLSLGRFSMYQQIIIAQTYNLPWVYLGYYVEKCPSLNYKADYKPHEIMQGEPSLTDLPIWLNPEEQ
ncbi:arginyltransferase [Sulfurospirillum arcachonense]|uniref:arginyltransferase n=1 Tax=Sulfurospirillum arcachonense TaxID=57666 RepID=UPI0004BC6874|nr:arginyltransferase [Sulfurospirillum arcachonense]